MNLGKDYWERFKQLRRVKGVMGGVCAGVAQVFDVPVWIVRLGWLLGIFVLWQSVGIVFFLTYFGMWLVLPKPSDGNDGEYTEPDDDSSVLKDWLSNW